MRAALGSQKQFVAVALVAVAAVAARLQFAVATVAAVAALVVEYLGGRHNNTSVISATGSVALQGI